MRALILGCGEAFDDLLPNTSVLLESPAGRVLFDCGYNVPPHVWRAVPDADGIDLIYLSHAHADHYFGMPALLGRWWEDGRTKPLTILSQEAVLEQLRDALELGYRGLAGRFAYPIQFAPALPGGRFESAHGVFTFAETRHAVSNLLTRLDTPAGSFCYSGDGMFTRESAALVAGADLVVHEAYSFESTPVHADIPALLEMAAAQGVRHLAMVHVQRTLRRNPQRLLEALSGTSATLPEPGTLIPLK